MIRRGPAAIRQHGSPRERASQFAIADRYTQRQLVAGGNLHAFMHGFEPAEREVVLALLEPAERAAFDEAAERAQPRAPRRRRR